MIKMYIDNEEVVCNKEFTIKEEMLSTSSTILNNCYPKSWEETKDYVSNFYYPKDYSKCLIYDEESLLPKEYTQVDYIQSNGTQYIDTTFIPTNNSKWVLDSQFNETSTQFNGRFENNENPRGQRFDIAIAADGYFYLNGGNNTKTIVADTNRHTFVLDMKNGIASIDDSNFDLSMQTFNGQRPAYLFARRANTIEYYCNEKIYNCKFYENDVLVMDLIPCYRNSDNEVGMYDLVNNVFYINKGTGTFTYGQVQETIISTLLFSGMVKNSGNISLNPRYPKYCSLEILDFKDFLSTGETLDFVINEKTISEAISMVVDTVSQYGFVLGNIEILNSDEVIGAYSTENKSAYDVLQYLADISQSRWTTRMIDENTIAIDFYDPTLMPSGIDIDYTQEWWCNNKVIDLSFNYGTRDYRNKQVMLSDEVYGGVDYDETILANGYNKTFLTASKVGIVKAIYVEGVAKTVATNEEKELGIEADFYYTPGENTFSCNENDSYSAGTQIVINYTPLVRGREVILNSDEISRINTNTGRKGIVARYETRNDVLSSNELKMVGETYIKYKGVAEVILTLQTKQDLYNVGESVYFDAPIDELSTDYMVKNKSTEIIATTGDVFYTYELTNSFNSESAINWFDNQRNKTTGNITMGQSINRNIDVEATANIIWDNLTITEVNITTDNVLNSPLNSPFVK